MTLASLGWGVWWIVLFLRRFVPAADPGNLAPIVASMALALAGLGIAVLTIRAKRSWLFFTCVPLFANGSLLGMPWLVSELERPD